MSIAPVSLLAAHLDLALLQSEVLYPHLVADRMLDRDWEHISPRLVADLIEAESQLDTIRLAAEAIGVPMPSPWQAARLAFDWLAYLLVTGRITASDVARARVVPNWRDRNRAPEEPTSEPVLAMMSTASWWMDDTSDLSPSEHERLLCESSAKLVEISRAVVAAPDWSFRDWPEAILTDPVLVAAVR